MASILGHDMSNSRCYCCRTASSVRPPQPACRAISPVATPSTSATDLDASLHELGMLSAVTDSRRDYVLEKLARNARSVDSGQHHSGLCVLAMNSAYIADFSFVTSHVAPPESPPSPSETVPLLTLRRPRVRALRRRHYFYQPYDYPWRPRLVEMLRAKEDESSAMAGVDLCFEEPQGLDCGNKSNPGSPSKLSLGGAKAGGSIVIGTVAGSPGIVRSKSLDDLEVCNAKACGTKVDIETVSRKIGNLHVS
ncbi:uncharacterized protein LOC144153704 [Haemaphysalis longicornis]|uniref:Uncharacterized protein n=1 Tax=Haemaphysalis longicornis TaxID=44386 RepID=A0A9J6H9J5_HAELO|nr:hypothetical protein HPB48_025504 [Haemaphysalis longicornis]